MWKLWLGTVGGVRVYTRVRVHTRVRVTHVCVCIGGGGMHAWLTPPPPPPAQATPSQWRLIGPHAWGGAGEG